MAGCVRSFSGSKRSGRGRMKQLPAELPSSAASRGGRASTLKTQKAARSQARVERRAVVGFLR
jgi:hypothetical protein